MRFCTIAFAILLVQLTGAVWGQAVRTQIRLPEDMMFTDRMPNSTRTAPRCFAARHFYRYEWPGATRVESRSSHAFPGQLHESIS